MMKFLKIEVVVASIQLD